MRRLPLVILLLGLVACAFSQSPHGAGLKANCADCHSAFSWEINADTLHFNHDTTAFRLAGRHAWVDCRDCHQSLVFQEASPECISCHTDIHRTTVGSDCARCHAPDNWLVDNITELHQENGFPLLGVHTALSCNDCHVSESALEFNRIGNDCINCHLDDFNSTTNPNHLDAGFSVNCAECHSIEGTDWPSDNVEHSFFPLAKGHEVEDCARCHAGGDFAGTPTDCFACHQQDYENSLDPSHPAANLPISCAECHTTDLGWMPAEYGQHDAFFPIYSGEHEGQWAQCSDCHGNSSSYAEFRCINCHVNPEADEGHTGMSGYVYENTACLACHPMGSTEGAFDHNSTNFPLTGAHLATDCILCHADGYAGTPTGCEACHTEDFNNSTNPNHQLLGLPTDCAACHSTEPGWSPAAFDIHDDYYALNGAHAGISTDCAACHNGDYNNTPNTCFGCHAGDYNQAADPNHLAAQFPTDCQSCHSESQWAPAIFDHDGQYFPIYSGKHEGEWNQCADCHTTPSNYAEFSCINCHINPETDDKHDRVAGYVYQNSACLACHPTGDADAVFDHNATAFPLAGAHTAADCLDCHSAGYAGTSSVCASCHTDDFNQTANPSHNALGFSTDCAACHTETAWAPSSFDHNSIYPFTGAHVAIASDCAACHNGDYANTPNDCAGCHTPDYNQSANPNHQALGFPTDCAGCHTTAPGWMPADFGIHNNYYALNGAHALFANDCAACHNGNYNNTPNTCAGCHINDYNQTTNPNHAAAQFPADCQSCHGQSAWQPATFNHDDMYFPIYSGKHDREWNSCTDCHTIAGNFSAFSCIDCHEHDNPVDLADKHSDVPGYVYQSNACYACHPTGEKN